MLDRKCGRLCSPPHCDGRLTQMGYLEGLVLPGGPLTPLCPLIPVPGDPLSPFAPAKPAINRENK